MYNNLYSGGGPKEPEVITINELGAGNSRTFKQNIKSNEWINKMINTGRYGYNTKSGALMKLETPLTGISKKDALKGTKEYAKGYLGVQGTGITNPKQDAAIAKLPQEQQQSYTDRNKQAREGYVQQNMEDVHRNPAWYLPGAIATAGLASSALGAAGEATYGAVAPYMSAPAIAGGASLPGATIANSIQAGFASDFITNRAPKIPGHIQEGNYGEAAFETGMGALDLLGAGMGSKAISSAGKAVKTTGKALNKESKLKSALEPIYRGVYLNDEIRNLVKFKGKTDDEILNIMGTTIPGNTGTSRKRQLQQTLNFGKDYDSALSHIGKHTDPNSFQTLGNTSDLEKGDMYILKVQPNELPFLNAEQQSKIYKETISAWKKNNPDAGLILKDDAKNINLDILKNYGKSSAFRTEGTNVIKGNFPQFIGAENTKIGNLLEANKVTRQDYNNYISKPSTPVNKDIFNINHASGGAVKSYAGGGYLNNQNQGKPVQGDPIKVSGPEPTRADSLFLYNNAQARNDFYKNSLDYVENPKTYLGEDGSEKQVPADGYFHTDFTDKDVRTNLIADVYDDTDTRWPSPSETRTSKELVDAFNAPDSMIGSQKFGPVPGTDLTKFGDIFTRYPDGRLNPNAPLAYLHPNITPQGESIYYSRQSSDWSSSPEYAPLAIKPWDMLTDAEKVERRDKYGDSGTPYMRSTAEYDGISFNKEKKSIPKRPQIKMDKMESIQEGTGSVPKELANIPPMELEKLIETERTGHDTGRGFVATGERRFYENPDGSRSVQREMYDKEMRDAIKNRKKPKREETKSLSFAGGGYLNNQNNMNYNQNYAGGGNIDMQSLLMSGLSGAATGSALGPIGAVGGALLGAGTSYMSQNNQPNQPNLYENVPNSLGSSSMSFAGGGEMISFQGPSHEQGGIQISPQAEVEGGETMVDDYIYSDRIKPKGSKKTYAELSKAVYAKYKMREGSSQPHSTVLTDKLAQESRKKELSTLREQQEVDPNILKLRAKTQAKEMAAGGQMYASGGPNSPVEHLLATLGQIGTDGSVPKGMETVAPGGQIDASATGAFAIKNYAAQKMACEAGDAKACTSVKAALTDNPNLEKQFQEYTNTLRQQESLSDDSYNYMYPSNSLTQGENSSSFMQLPGLQNSSQELQNPFNSSFNQPGNSQIGQPINNQPTQVNQNPNSQPRQQELNNNYNQIQPKIPTQIGGSPTPQLQGQLQTLPPAPSTLGQGSVSVGTGGRGLNVNNDSTFRNYTPREQNPGGYDAYKGYSPEPQPNQRNPLLANLDRMPGVQEEGQSQGYQPNFNSLGSYVPGALMNSIGPAAQLAGTLIGGPDETSFDRVNPRYINPSEAINATERQGALGRANLNRSVAQGSRTAGQLMGNTVAGNAGITNNVANSIGGIRQTADNANVGTYNQANARNAGISQQETIANEQNNAAYRQALYGSMTDIGNIGAGVNKDYRMDRAQEVQNTRLLNTINSAGFNYMYDENGNLTYNR